MARRAGSAPACTELTRIEREIRKLVEAIKNGVSATAFRDELMALERKQAEDSSTKSPSNPTETSCASS
jgi:hypothetical protein